MLYAEAGPALADRIRLFLMPIFYGSELAGRSRFTSSLIPVPMAQGLDHLYFAQDKYRIFIAYASEIKRSSGIVSS